jgi:polysaccharide deacetylase family protein (PEP-CTERM system associated)
MSPDSFNSRMLNALSIDVEDVHSVVMRKWFGKDEPPSSAVVTQTEYILEQLSAFNIHATFFILGEVVQAYPDLIKRISSNNHELAVHGYKHYLVSSLKPDDFRYEVETTKKMIEDLTGQRVYGHRAPAFSISLDMQWAFEILTDVGFTYDSSINPATIPYSVNNKSAKQFKISTSSGQLQEIPPAGIAFMGRYWPVCGGGYFRHFPYSFSRWLLKKINESSSAVLYLHPYELFVQPKTEPGENWPVKKKLYFYFRRFLHNRNCDTMKPKLQQLLEDFDFAPIKSVYQKCLEKGA